MRHEKAVYTSPKGGTQSSVKPSVYSPSACADLGAADKPVFIVNATGRAGVLVSLAAAPKAVRAFDVLGREVPVAVPPAGLSRVEVPASGHLESVW